MELLNKLNLRTMNDELKNKIIIKSFEFEDESGITMQTTITIEDLFKILSEFDIKPKTIDKTLPIQNVVDSYSEKDMDNAYDKGFADAMKKYRTDL